MRYESVSGPREEFVSFYEAAKDDCLRAVIVSVGDVDIAEDLVAEAFARAWATWNRVVRHPVPRAWIVRTALNVHISSWRRHGRPIVPNRPSDLAYREDPATEPFDPALMDRLRKLPARQREVIALRVFLDLDTAQTGEILGISPGTVTAHLARAVAALRTDYVESK